MWAPQIIKYNPGGKYHLSYRRQLHLRSYFDLARRPFEEQTVPAVIMNDLSISDELVQEFITKSAGIRTFYARLRPQEWWDYRGTDAALAALQGRHDELPRTMSDKEIIARDPFLSNVHFMSDLGLMTKRAATKLTEELGNIANLAQWTVFDLNTLNLNNIPQIGPVYALEIFRVLTAWGASPQFQITIDDQAAKQLVRAGLEISGKYEVDEICALFRRTAAPEVTKVARSDLRRAGVSNPAISIAFDVLVV